ncbi:MAG TPA: tRNA (adenosine(37)-N6)-threonylcarbamoyltransferase complex dimerization subunit type 1 TsaB [Candidatus Binatia bacterium]
MRILGVDTATAAASVALLDDGESPTEGLASTVEISGATSPELRGDHAEIVLPLIDSVLRKAWITIADLSGIAVSIGPGSFTGLRIGLATVKGIAYRWGLPVVGISTLLANATRVKRFDGVICSLLDARKGEVYVGVFRGGDRGVTRLRAEAVTPIESAIELIRSYESADDAALCIIGDGAKAYENVIVRVFGARLLRLADGVSPSVASAVAELAHARLAVDSGDDLGALEPVYLRSPKAEKKNKESIQHIENLCGKFR